MNQQESLWLFFAWKNFLYGELKFCWDSKKCLIGWFNKNFVSSTVVSCCYTEKMFSWSNKIISLTQQNSFAMKFWLIELFEKLNSKIAVAANCFVYFNKEKLNSNLYHYKPKFISTSKQNYNWKFQEFKTIRTLKI